MKELIIEFGNDTLGETRMYQRNLKGYEQAIKDMKLYKAQQKAEIEYLKAQITAECKEHQEAMQVADKTIKTLEKALEICHEKLVYIASNYTNLTAVPSKEHFKTKAEEMTKDEL